MLDRCQRMEIARVILLEHGPGARPVAFREPHAVVAAWTPEEVAPALAQLAEARATGRWVAGYLSYEAGYALEPRLLPLLP